MKNCCVCGYKKRSLDDDVSFHQFPQNKQRCASWVSAIPKDNFIPKKHTVICSDHFNKDCFYYSASGLELRRLLKSNSVPTIFNVTKELVKDSTTELCSENIEGQMEEMVKEKTVHIKKEVVDNENLLSNPSFQCDLSKSNSTITQELCEIETPTEPFETKFLTIDNIMSSTADIEVTKLMESSEKLCLNKETKQDGERDIIRIPHVKETQKMKGKYHLNPRYFGDCDSSDMTPPQRIAQNWKIASETISNQRRKIGTLRKQNIRLKRKVDSMTSVMKLLKDKQFITDDVRKILSMNVTTSQKLKKNKFLNSSEEYFTECDINKLSSGFEDKDNNELPEVDTNGDDLEVTSEEDENSEQEDNGNENGDNKKEEKVEERDSEEDGSSNKNCYSFRNKIVKIPCSEAVTIIREPVREFQPFETVDIPDASMKESKCYYSIIRGCPGSSNTQRLVERHFPSLIPATGKKKRTVRRCVVCSAVKKQRKEVQYFCEDCGVALCISPCFKIYHTKLYF